MTRVLSYNILVGGTHRVEQLTKVIGSRRPDVIGLIEATDEQVVKEVAKHLDMQYRLSGRAQDEEGWQAAVLSRLPILDDKTYMNQILTKQPLLEVSVREQNGQKLTLFVTHLTAAFGKRKAAYQARRNEVQEILRIMAASQGTPHLLMGDFNSLAPRERLKGSSFLQYVVEPSLYYQLKPDEFIRPPDLNFVLPSSLRFLKPLLEFIPRSKFLSYLLDSVDFLYAPWGGLDMLNEAGYVDCFRSIHHHESGFTWPAPIPSGRVDFIFACSQLADRLLSCDVVIGGEGIATSAASDHLPIVADFLESHEKKQKETVKMELHSQLRL